MNATGHRTGSNWSARLLVGLILILIGASAATWGLARYEPAARFLGVRSAPAQTAYDVRQTPQPGPATAPPARNDERVAMLESRLARVENSTQRTEGSVGRADALLVAFAARRAIDRGVALGYLENLLVGRFAAQHRQAVATIISTSHNPVRLSDLIAEYEALGPDLRRGGPNESWWTNFKREIGSLVEIHRADQPSPNSDARYRRAVQRLYAGEVDDALVETMRLPGAAHAGDWVGKARRYVAVHRALDEVESSALLGGVAPSR